VYDDVVADVRHELLARVDAAVHAGVDPDQIVLDPGLGFAKTAEHDWALLHRLDEFAELGFPLLIGASRKSFLGRLLADPDGPPRPSTSARTPRPRSPPTRRYTASGACACTTCGPVSTRRSPSPRSSGAGRDF